jgi:hypothetical protein
MHYSGTWADLSTHFARISGESAAGAGNPLLTSQTNV